jgi:arginine/serine-rich splicing factor 4/5/6
VEFHETQDCADAIAGLNNADVLGIQGLVVEAAKIRNGSNNIQQKGFRVNISNLDSRVSWQDLKDFAREAGTVMFTNVFIQDGYKVGVIEYETEEACENAIRLLDGKPFQGSEVSITRVISYEGISTE